MSRASPPENGEPSARPSNRGHRSKKNLGRAYPTTEFSANGNRRQPQAEDLVRRFSSSPIRDDAWIPPCLRTLEKAERELRHDGLALAISAAEWHYCDLVIWQSYPSEFTRAECWKHIRTGLDWVVHLRRRRTLLRQRRASDWDVGAGK